MNEGAVRGPDGVLAGSVLTMIEAVRNLHALGAPLEQAVAAATSTPARFLGEPESGGSTPGLPADIVVLNDAIEIERVARRRRHARRDLGACSRHSNRARACPP